MKEIDHTHNPDSLEEIDYRFRPRKLCSSCVNWISEEDAFFNDLPHCTEVYNYDCDRYLIGSSDTCPKYFQL